MHFVEDQAFLRSQALAKRAALSIEERAKAADNAAQHAVDLVATLRGRVAVFLPIRDEIDTLPLLSRLTGGGVKLSLPVMQGHGLPLLFRRYSLGDVLDKATFGVREPKSDKDLIEPDLLFVPLTAFDRSGGRIGYGGGFYDRTLVQLRGKKSIQAIGYGFACQEVEAVPMGPYDQRLDAIICENGRIDIALPSAGD